MKKFAIVVALAATTVLSTSASAFWGGSPWSSGNGGGPWSGMGDMFGMNELNFNTKSYGHGNGYGYGNPYYGYNSGYPGYGGYGGGYPGYGYGAPYGVAPYGAPVAPVAPQAPAAQ